MLFHSRRKPGCPNLHRGEPHSDARPSPATDDFGVLEPRNNRPGFNKSWQLILDVRNNAGQGGEVEAGIHIYNATDPNDNVNLEFYGSGANGGFNFIGVTDDVDDPRLDVRANPKVTKGSVSFSKSAKLFTFSYDSTGSTDGFQWRKLCTFSPTGSGGTRRGNWKLNAGSGSFGIMIFGYAEFQTVASGKVQMDNFVLKAWN